MFAKYDNGQLFTAITHVKAPNFELNSELKDTYAYPVEGWYWLDTVAEACAFFGCPLPESPVDKTISIPEFMPAFEEFVAGKEIATVAEMISALENYADTH